MYQMVMMGSLVVLHRTPVMRILDGAQLEGHVLLLRAHGKRRWADKLAGQHERIGEGRRLWYEVEETVTGTERLGDSLINLGPEGSKDKIGKIKGNGSDVGCSRGFEESR